MKRFLLSTIAASLILISCNGKTIYREIPSELTIGTDSACIDAWNWLLDEMESTGADRVEITNRGWIPLEVRAISKAKLSQMIHEEIF